MKVLIVGEGVDQQDLITTAVRLRWPDASFQNEANPPKTIDRLESAGFDVVVVMSRQAAGEVPALCRGIRASWDVPIIVIGDRESERGLDEAHALEAGADDYVRDSVGFPELVARFVALMRRARATVDVDDTVARCGPLLLKPASFEAFLGSQNIELTATEFQLLHILTRRKGTVVRHQVIERALWGDNVDSSMLVKKYVHRLRRKLDDASGGAQTLIRSVYGIGYMLVAEETLPTRELQASA